MESDNCTAECPTGFGYECTEGFFNVDGVTTYLTGTLPPCHTGETCVGALWNPNLTSHEATSTGGNILRWPLGLGYDNGEAILDGAWQHAGHCTCDNYESPTGHGWHTLEYTYGRGGSGQDGLVVLIY